MPRISLSLTFLINNDNNLVASSFEDNTIRFAKINETSLNDTKFNYGQIILKGHTHFVKVITALNKTILASGSCDNTIILWDILSSKLKNNLTGHTGCINALISIPYGDSSNLLISGSSDSKIKLWLSNGTELKSNGIDYFENNKPVNALAYGTLDYSAYIASASDENIIKIWSYNDLSYEKQIIDLKNITNLTIINKTLIVTVHLFNESLDEIKVWNNTSEEPIFAFNSTTINTIKALPNSNLVIVTNKIVDIYDLNFKLIQKLNHSFEVNLLDVSTRILITASPNQEEDKTELIIWDLETFQNKRNATLIGNIIAIAILLDQNITALTDSNKFYVFDHTITQVFYRENENTFDSLVELKNYNLVIGSSSIGLIEIWNIKSKSLSKSLNTKKPVSSLIEFKEFLISSHEDGSILVWDLNLFIIKSKISSGHKNNIKFYSLLQLDDLNLISFSNDSLFKWKFSEKLRIDSKPHLTENIQNPITALLFFSNKKLLAGSSDSILHVFDRNLTYKETLKGHEKQITCLISINDYSFASASEDSLINLWSEENSAPNPLRKSHNSKINSIVYNSNLNMIISGSMDGQIIIWQNSTKLIFKEELIGHSRQIEHLIFLDKDTIASASDDHTILIWNNSRIQFNLTNHTDNINALTRLENGNLASCSRDKTIKIWDKNNNFSLITTLYGHLRSVICLKSIDDHRLVSGSCDKKLIVWNITTRSIIKEINDAHSDCINTLAMYNGHLLSGSDDKKVKIWNLKNWDWTYETLQQKYSVKSIVYGSFIAINNGNSFNIYNNYSKFARFDTLTEHSESIESLAIMPSNENIVSGSRDNTVKIWNSTTFQLIATLLGHTNWVNALAIIPSNENVVSGSNDKTIKIWNSKTFRLIATLKNHADWVNALAIIPSNENIVSGSDDKTIKVWNSKTLKIITTLKNHTEEVNALAIIPSNENIVSGSYDKTIKVWNSTTYKLIATLTGHTNFVRSLAIIRSNENIISGSDDKTIKIWNSRTFQLIATLTGHTDWIRSLAIIPSSENIISCSDDKTIKIWNSHSYLLKLFRNCNSKISRYSSNTNLEYLNKIYSLAIIPSSKNIVSGSDDKTIKVWNSTTLQLISTLTGHTDLVNVLAIIPSNENVVSGSNDRKIKIWNSTSFQLIETLMGHNNWIRSLAIIPSNENIVSCSDDGIIKIWNSTTFQLIANLTGHSNWVNALAFNPSNENKVSDSNDRTIKVWNLKLFKFVTSLAIIPSNENIVSGSYDKTIKVWNSITFKLVATLTGHTDWIRSLAIIPSSENIISGSDDKTIKVWNSTTFQLIETLIGHDKTVSSLAIIPSNENIVSGSYDQTIKIWNSTTFQLIYTLTGHTNLINALAIIPSNENIVSGSDDRTIRVWNITEIYLNMDNEILDLKFLSNFHLSTCSRNGIVRVWNFFTCEIIAQYNNSNFKTKKHLSLDYYLDTGDLAYSEDRLIKILNTGLLYSNFSNNN